MGRLPDLDDFLDPKSLTPQELYKLQSDTWAQGVEYERDRIIKLLEDRLSQAKSFEGDITAMQVIVDVEVLEVIVHAMIHAINQEQDEQDN
jgi:hypothetical protein